MCLGYGWADVTQAQDNPHGNYSATADACAACHRSHTAPTSSLIVFTPEGNAFCAGCHNGVEAPAVSTHANIDFSGGAEVPFELECVQCHDPHDNSNLFSIRELVRVNPTSGSITGPVVFTATTGPDSYDDGAGDPASRLCVACHANSNNPGYPVTGHVGGANHQGGANFSGQACPACHPHNAD
ncbi:MAG: cytochrome c3 family protein, partial [Chloroflexota bacterium]